MLAILFQEKTKKMLVFPKNAEKNASIIEKGLFVPKNDLREIRMGIGPIWGSSSLTPLSSLAYDYRLIVTPGSEVSQVYVCWFQEHQIFKGHQPMR